MAPRLFWISSMSFFISQCLSQDSNPVIGAYLNTDSCFENNGSCNLYDSPLQNPTPYYFPAEERAGTSNLFPMRDCNGHTIEEATIDQLQNYMSHGTLTSVQLVTCYLQRVLQINEYVK